MIIELVCVVVLAWERMFIIRRVDTIIVPTINENC